MARWGDSAKVCRNRTRWLVPSKVGGFFFFLGELLLGTRWTFISYSFESQKTELLTFNLILFSLNSILLVYWVKKGS